MARVVKVSIEGQFLTDNNKKFIIPGPLKIRTLNEKLVKHGQINCDMFNGYDKYTPYEPYGTNLTSLLQFISSRLNGKDLETVIGANIVTRRNFLVKLAEGEHIWKSNFDEGFVCLCCKLNRVIFLWKILDKDTIHTNPEKHIYAVRKFETLVTLKKGQIKENIDEIPSTKYDNNVVYRCQLNTQHGEQIKIYYSNKEDCIDKHGKYVELTACKIKTRQNSIRYYLRALFAKHTRLIIGEKNGDMSYQLNEMNPIISLSTVKATPQLNYLSKLLSDIQREINQVEDGIFMLLTRLPHKKTYSIKVCSDEELVQFDKEIKEFDELIVKRIS